MARRRKLYSSRGRGRSRGPCRRKRCRNLDRKLSHTLSQCLSLNRDIAVALSQAGDMKKNWWDLRDRTDRLITRIVAILAAAPRDLLGHLHGRDKALADA